MTYWPWWAGSIALGAIAVGYARFSGRALGVSGTMRRAARPIEERAVERAERAVMNDPAAFQAALLAATQAAFGGEAASDATSSASPATSTRPAAMVHDDESFAPPSPWIGQLAFVVMMAVGAFLVTSLRGGVSLHATPGPAFEHLVASGWKIVPALLLGGALVGFGTRMSGGCTSGHGLSGCGRLLPSSLVATAAFFGMGIVTSFVLAWIAGGAQ